MTKAFLIDLNKCYGCQNCVISCKDEFVDNDWSPYSVPEPDSGQKWMNVTYQERGTYPKIRIVWTATPCMHCTNAPCIKAATGGAVYRRSDGIVIIDPVKAVGQKQIVSSCPYGVIYWNQALNLPQKCTGCAHILDNSSIDGGSLTPRCVMACPVSAIGFDEYANLKPLIDANGALPLHPEYGTQPNVYYIGLPKRFVTGRVVDGSTGGNLQGANVAASDLVSGATYTTTTDVFGDFWFDGLDLNKTYNVTVSAPGRMAKALLAFTGTDKNLGDITLF